MVAAAHTQLLGVALSHTELCALLSAASGGTPQLWRVTVGAATGMPSGALTGAAAGALPAAAPDNARSLRSAFAELAAAVGAGAGKPTVRIPALALMPSLAEMRAVALPPLSEADARQLLARNGSRYFRTATPPLAVALATGVKSATAAAMTAATTAAMTAATTAATTAAPTGGTDNASATHSTRMVAATSAALLQELYDAAQAVGLQLGGVVPSEAAWGAALPSTGALLVCETHHVHLLTVADGAVVGVRRFRRPAEDREALIDAVRDGGGRSLRVCGDAGACAEADALLRAAGVATDSATISGVSTSLMESPEAIAAFGAAAAYAAQALRLETDRDRARRTATQRRTSWQLASTGAVALVMAASVYLWGLNRELGAVRAERALLAPQLGSTLVGRTTVEAAFRQLAALDSANAAAPRWSLVLGAVSRELPGEAFLTGFRGRADTVSIDGLAVSAARVFDAVERLPMLQGVHASSPVQRETTAEGEALDRFQLAAQLRATPYGSAPTRATPARSAASPTAGTP